MTIRRLAAILAADVVGYSAWAYDTYSKEASVAQATRSASMCS
jgi:hypothetical protein